MMTFVLQAQTVPVLPTIESVTQHLRSIRQQQAAQLREEVSCTRETELDWNSASMKWDSAYQTISKVEEVDGKTNIVIESYEYDEVEGHVLTEEIHAYGIEGFINLEDERIAYEAVGDLLASNPDLVGIYVAGGGQEGMIRALRDERAGGRIVAVCNELTSTNRSALLDGTVDLALRTPIESMAVRAVELMAGATGAISIDVPAQVLFPAEIFIGENA